MNQTLPRVLQFRDLVLLTLGGVIGSGIFIVPATVVQLTGGELGPALLVWVAGGVLSILGALTYAELGAMKPESGGLYVYLRDAFGGFIAFLYGWALFFVISSATIATLAVAFAGYLGQLVPLSAWGAKAVAVGMVAVVAVINITGTRRSANVQNWTTVLKVSAILIMSVLLLARGHELEGARLVPSSMELSLLTGMGVAMIGVLWAYEGWHYVTFAAGEALDPQRNFARAIIVGTAALIGIYLLANVAYVAALGPERSAQSERIAADAVAAIFGSRAGKLIALAILISMFSAANATVLTATRAYFAMARDGVFFKAMGEVHPRWNTPALAIAGSSAWAAIMAATGTFDELLTYVVFAGWIFYGLGAASIFYYRRREPDAVRSFRTPGYPWTPILFILAAGAIVLNTVLVQPGRALLGIALVLLGAPAFWFWRRKQRVPALTTAARELSVAALLFAAVPAFFFAQPASASGTDDLSVEERMKIDALFKEYDTSARPGCALGVMRNGRLAYARGYGMADVERHVPITVATLFDIASTSKQFTASAVVLLELDGKLALSDEVRKYIPELPDYGAPITIDHLMRHTSGLRDYTALLSLAGLDEQVTNDEQALAVIARQRKLNFPRGSRYEYSNSGYFLLSVIVQRVSGKSLADFARERIFLPLGMTRTRFRDKYAMLIPGRALGYSSDDKDGFSNAVSNWVQTGDGGLHLSIEEALKWDENFYDPRVGGRAFVERLQEPGKLANGEAITYARGLVVDKYRGLARVHHGGAWVGYRSMLERFPEQHTSIAILCNFEEADPTSLSDQVADIVLAGKIAAADPAPAAQQAGSRRSAAAKSLPYQRFLGSYFVAESDTIFEVTQAEQALTLKIGSTSLPLIPVGRTSFAVQGFPVTVDFSVAGRKPAHSLQLQIESDPATTAARFAPATPGAEDLQAYTGTFYSPELDVTWPIVVSEGRLAVRRETRKFASSVVPLEPAMADAFNGEVGFMRFTRAASGRVTGFDLSSSRMRGIRFEPRPQL